MLSDSVSVIDVSSVSFSVMDVKSVIAIFSEHDFQHLANIAVADIVFVQSV